MKEIYQLKITLTGSKPPIWRRVLVPSDFTLNQLHDVIQNCFAWDGSHLYAFEIGKKSYDDENPRSLNKKLNTFSFGVKSKFKYIYDFGDYWEHDILVEKILADNAKNKYPQCTGGARAAPPEDCGGVHGYEYKLSVLTDKKHPEYEEVSEWLGEDFDPQAFDVEEANAELEFLR